MTTLLVTHPCFLNHLTGPGHPERPDRMRAIDRVLGHELFKDLARQEAPLREDVEEQILLAHPREYLEAIKAARPRQNESIHLDPDTVMSAGTWEAALRAVGAGLLAVDKVFDADSGISNAFCQVRPCGHHAEKDRAMGFCLFSNVAIAGMYARARHGPSASPSSISTCTTATARRTSSGRRGPVLRLHAPDAALSRHGRGGRGGRRQYLERAAAAGDGGEPFREAVESRILPALRNFGPDLVLISAGFDAHEADPLANLRLVEADFMWVTEKLAEAAGRHCNGRIVSMLEGGYDLTALARSVGVHVRTLMDAGA